MLEKVSQKICCKGVTKMSQQLVNGSYRKSDVTFTFRMSDRYAVVSEPFNGKHKKPQDVRSRLARKQHWRERNESK